MVSEFVKDKLRQVVWVCLHTIILGAFVLSYTSIVRNIQATDELYLAIGSFTVLLVIYVICVLLMDRIARQMKEIAESVESISESVENISDSVPDDDSQ